MDDDARMYIRGAVEALLFISDKPVPLDQITEALETVETADIRQAVKDLKHDYDSRDCGMTILEVAGGYQMLSNPQYSEFVRNFFKTRVKEKLSRPALEVLSITAYRQPVSRGDVELIRGVNSDAVVNTLTEKGLVKIVGRKDVPGRPYLYGTSKAFLEYFGLKSLKDLPKLEEFIDQMTQDALPGEDGEQKGQALFDSNQKMDMSEAVGEAGDDHVNQSFARGTELSPDGPVSDEDSGESIEEPEDLKKVMDEMTREQPVAVAENADVDDQASGPRDDDQAEE
ncbi:MAG: SMC-Scp complex subunit ScpB [Candidatus Omnitrophota bacterium]